MRHLLIPFLLLLAAALLISRLRKTFANTITPVPRQYYYSGHLDTDQHFRGN